MGRNMAAEDEDNLFLYGSSEEDEAGNFDVTINSEQDVWDLIRLLSREDQPVQNISIKLGDVSWAKLNVIYDGDEFEQSLTADAMKGLVDFQTSFYQSIGLLLKGTRKASVLTEDEREAFRLVFKVGPGSSDVEAKGDDKFTEILSRIVDTMESKHLLYCALLALVLYFGKGGLDLCLNHNAEIKRIEEQSQDQRGLQALIHEMSEANKENIKTLAELARKNEAVKELTTGSIEAHESIIKHSSGTNKLTVNGREITPRAASDIISNPRRSSTSQLFEGVYSIENVDPSNPQQFVIRLRNLSDGVVFQAKLVDAVAMEEFKPIIRDAEWNRSRVLLKIRARKVGETFRNAEIISAKRMDPN